MTIRDKYFGWKDIFFDRFVHCCNEKSDQPQGSNIPLAKINFDNKTGYVEDGTINIAELLQYLWINNKVYRCEYAPIDISSALQTLIRLTENAKHMFEDQPGVYDMIPYRGFFLRDDFSSGKDYSLDLDKIVSGMGGWYGEDFNYAKSVYYQVFLTDSKEVIQNMMHGIIYGKWTFVKRGENFGIKLVKVLPKIHKISLDMIAKDIFRPEKL